MCWPWAGWRTMCASGLHGDVTYFNVNRHINPTNVCVAACKLCAFGRKKGDPAGYTMALDEAWATAASGYSEAVTEFHIVGVAPSRLCRWHSSSTWCAA
jgi:aminodeoxyfutalosine synthase